MQLKLPAIFSRVTFLLLITACLSACATPQKTLTGIIPGREVDTLQSSISMSIKSRGHGAGGRGYLIFRYPDRFHMAMLSPFGLTVLEIFSDGDRLTFLVPSKQTAYRGLIDELPPNGGFQTLGLLKWLVARPQLPADQNGAREVVSPSGDRLFLDKNGLVVRKVSPGGDEASFSGYSNVNGVAFPESMDLKNSLGDTAHIVFDEPEINVPVENSALTPNLEGITILPFSEFKGF